MKKKISLFIVCSFGIVAGLMAQRLPYQDISLPTETRVKDLISRLTLEEKVGQMKYNSPAVSRLGIPEYNWWNEALHGVGRSGPATVFPQAIGMAATFDDQLIFKVADVVSTEARAMNNVALAKGYHMKYGGLTFWTPNINIFRDPRWGRGQETYGEDPFLTASMGVAFVKGLQGTNPKYMKVAACAKHFAVHSGPERLRHEFNAKASMHDLYDTYLPAFKALVDNKVEAVMCAYNRTNDEPCCANTYLLQEVLRKKWNFKGHILSDCWALVDFYAGHKVVKDATEAAALAVKKGVDLNCGSVYGDGLLDAVKKGMVSEKELDAALVYLFNTRFKLGMFDPATGNPYTKIGENEINSTAHRTLARTVAQKSIVMLKNNGVLPLRNDLRKYFITGPNAVSVDALLGNYNGLNSNLVTVVEGIAAQVKNGSQLQYRPGTLLARENVNPIDWTTEEAKNSDVAIAVLGIHGFIEGEEGESIESPNFGDRLDYNLPKNQVDFLRKMRKDNNKPIITIITGGSPMNLAEVQELSDAVLLVWYPGEEGGNAVADVIFGKVNPSGRLPITFPRSLDQLPAYEDYSMKGRTYRYMNAEPLYPFGFGLSYTSFQYTKPVLSNAAVTGSQSSTVSVTVTNSGKKAGEEVVQLYLTHTDGPADKPLYALKGFKRVQLNPGASTEVKFTLTPDMLKLVNDAGESVIVPGKIKISIGGSLPGKRSEELGASPAAQTVLTVNP
jgi:beta-glucosidase